MPLKVDGNAIKIVPQSPLAQSQNLEDLENVMKFLQIAQGLGPIGQVALNQDEAIDYIAENLGVPGNILNTRQQRQEIVQQMTQMAEQAAEGEAEEAAPTPEAVPA